MTTAATTTGYAFLDCGDRRRLERFGPYVIDRPAPAAAGAAGLDRSVWAAADGRFERSSSGGRWRWRDAPPEEWTVRLDGLELELRPAAGGQVGLFPEQLPMWSSVAVEASKDAAGDEPPEVLNLFGYTGGATLAAARAGARVTHVDASRSAIAWARRNAERSGVADRPIRWLADDALGFVRRELRRGRTYDGVVLDPPTYGHGPSGRPWRLVEHLDELLSGIAALVSERRGFVVLTGHTTDLGPADLREAILRSVDRRCESGWLELAAGSGRRLRLGAWAGVPRGGR